MSDKIVCRSQKSENCSNGKSVTRIFGPNGSMSEDGTFDGKSIVCDACYIAIGQPSVPANSPGAEMFGATIEQDN